MNRRETIALIGGAAVWPAMARAQQLKMPVIGYIGSTPEADVSRLRAFRQGLGEAGFVEGRNVTIEYRWNETTPAKRQELAVDLIRRRVSVIVAVAPMAAVAKAATSTIPIVFWGAPDAVQIGLAESLNRPGANLTGITNMGTEIGSKRLGLMHELLPSAMRHALVMYSNGLILDGPLATEMTSAAEAVGGHLDTLTAGTIGEIDGVFASLAERRTESLFVAPSVFFTNRRVQFTTLATRHSIPALYTDRQFVEVGGLISYGTEEAEMHRQVGLYAGRILKGEKPGELPVVRASKFELVINLGTAKTLALTVSDKLLALADEVIE